MRGATTTATLLALSGAALLAAAAPAAGATMRWTVTLEGSIVQTGERTTRTTSADGCTLERTEQTSERWLWKTAAPVAIRARGAGTAVELTRGGRRGTIRIPVVVTGSATSTVGAASSGGTDCAPGFGSSSLCDASRPWTDLSVALRWNARSGRLETGPPAPTPAALRRRAGGCGTALDGAASLAERPFPELVTSRALSFGALLGAAGPLSRQALDVTRRSEPGRASEQRTARALVRLMVARR